MRTPAAVLVVGVAAALGTLAGAVVLPDREVEAGGNPSTTSAPLSAASPIGSASPRPSAPPPPSALDRGPVRSANMLTATDFREVGLTVTPQRSDVRLELVVCDEKETLDDVALSGPPLQQLWEAGSIVATEQAIAARDGAEATYVARRVLRKLEACQEAVPGHWVYGPSHTERLGQATRASWLGTVDGELNTTGRAPRGEKISGGIAVLRHGLHVAVLYISWCASAGDTAACVVADGDAYEQLAALSRAAARRLG